MIHCTCKLYLAVQGSRVITFIAFLGTDSSAILAFKSFLMLIVLNLCYSPLVNVIFIATSPAPIQE